MQSFLQYRRYGKAVEAEFAQDREKASGSALSDLIRTDSEHARASRSRSSSSSKPSTIRSIASADREKVESDSNTESPPRPSSPVTSVGAQDETPARSAKDKEVGVVPVPHRQRPRRWLSRSSRGSEPNLQRIGTELGVALTGVDVRSRTTNEGRGQPGLSHKVFIVGFQGEDDPLNPHNWGYWRRVAITMLLAAVGFVVGFASSVDSSALEVAAADFGVSPVVESMATGLYLIGFGVGALLSGPFSEAFGRNPIYILTFFLYMVFIMASALAPNIGAQLAFRFLAGVFGSTPLTCAGGSVSDLWNPMERVLMFPIFANAVFSGPVMGPVVGGFIAQSRAVSWRWVDWTSLIMSGLVFGCVILFLPETYAPLLLKWRAEHLRRVTGDTRYRGDLEVRQDSLLTRSKRALYLPLLLTVKEPIIILITAYLTVIYIILFTFLDGYNYIFADIHGLNPGLTGLCFLGIVVGLFSASALVPLIYRWAKRDLKKIEHSGGTQLPPEFRLWFSMLGGSVALPVSLFWMGWTSDSHISIWSPLAASVLFGYGVLCVFISSYQYIIDSYETYTASALASATLIRYCAAGGMTVAGIPFYQNLGVHWTLTVLGGLAAVMAPLPYVFYRYGSAIRKRSKYAVTRD